MIIAYVSIVSVEVLTHLENTSGSAVFSPEIFGDFGDRIDTDAIEAILLNKVTNPVLEVAADVGVALI